MSQFAETFLFAIVLDLLGAILFGLGVWIGYKIGTTVVGGKE
jgi:hypothetical protein